MATKPFDFSFAGADHFEIHHDFVYAQWLHAFHDFHSELCPDPTKVEPDSDTVEWGWNLYICGRMSAVVFAVTKDKQLVAVTLHTDDGERCYTLSEMGGSDKVVEEIRQLYRNTPSNLRHTVMV